jgi:hypothetical protein
MSSPSLAQLLNLGNHSDLDEYIDIMPTKGYIDS